MTISSLSPSGWSRREFLRLGASAIVLSAMAGSTACGPDKPLRIAIHPWVGYQFIFLAQQEGLLPRAGLELLETTNLSESARALAEGRVDGAALTLDEVLGLRDQGIPLSAVLVFNVSAGADALLAGPDIKTPADLKGKRLGVEASSLGAVMLSKVLEAGGLQRSDVVVAPMTENHAEAWNEGKMDALLTYEPFLSSLEKGGALHRVFDSRSMPGVILDVLAVRREAAERHAGVLRAVIAGDFQALKLWRSNPMDTSYYLSERLGVNPDEVGSLYKGLDLPDMLYNRKYLTPPAQELTRSATEIAQIMQREGLLKQPLNLDRLFLADYLPRGAE
jgi:NitT/TauT family transport system substrate-binding protein